MYEMNTCIICGEPCKGEICDACIDEFPGIDLKVFHRLSHAASSRRKQVSRANKEEELMEDE